MEFGKIEKIDLSNIRVRVTMHGPLRIKIESLQVGEAVTVEGVERESIENAQAALRKDGRKFTNRKLGLLQFQIIRIK